MATGAKSSVTYGYETTFGTPATAITNVFGRGVSISTAEFNNNHTPIYGIGKRSFDAWDTGRFETSLTIEFNFSNAKFLDGFFGAPVSNKYTLGGTPKSVTIKECIPNLNGKGTVFTYAGCIATDCTISLNNESACKVTINYLCAKVTKLDDQTIIVQTEDSEPVYTFPEGHFLIGTTELSAVQSAEININQNAELIYGVGNRFGVGEEYKQMEITLNCVNRYEKAGDYLNNMFGSATSPTQTGATPMSSVKVNFTSLQGGSSLSFNCKDSIANTYSAPVSYENIVTETVDLIVRDLEITVTAPPAPANVSSK